MKLIATKPDAKFAVWDLPETQAAFAAVPQATLLPLLHGLTCRLTREPGKMLRALADLACELCGADAAGICMERGELPTPSPAIPIVIAAGTCASMSGAEVPRPQSGCAMAIQHNRPKLFQVPANWLPVDAPPDALAHGITAPWTAGNTHGTLWMLSHQEGRQFGAEDQGMLVTLASLVGIAVTNLLQQEDFRGDIYRGASDSLTSVLARHVQEPLQAIRVDLARGIGMGDEPSRTRHLRRVSEELDQLSGRVAELLDLQKLAA